jgi:hypothetical protein
MDELLRILFFNRKPRKLPGSGSFLLTETKVPNNLLSKKVPNNWPVGRY